MRRLAIALVLASQLSSGETSEDRLATAAKLWNYVKYFHPRVTEPEIDWDASFAKVIPKVIAATNDDQFAEAMQEMLGDLQDPATYVALHDPPSQSVPRTRPGPDGVTIIEFENGDPTQAMPAADKVAKALANGGNFVFDLRDRQFASWWAVLSRPLPAAKPCVGPFYATREHSGYANAGNWGSGGYASSWKMNGSAFAAADKPVRAVFLINSRSSVPSAALTVQTCGVGAIVSEDAVKATQADTSQLVPGLGNVRALVRTSDIFYGDGTTGFSVNAVLHKTGDEALGAAVELARTGTWPPPEARPRRPLPPAGFSEKNYTGNPYPAKEYRIIAAARVWGVFEYFHPYRHLYGESWSTVLTTYMGKLARAEDARQYHLAVAEMVAHTHDSHCYVWSDTLQEFYGRVPAGLELQWIENRPVVLRVVDESLKQLVHPGDVVTRIDGKGVQERVDTLTPYLAASTPQALMVRLMGYLLSGAPGTSVKVTFETANGERDIDVRRTAETARLLRPSRTGDTFRLLTPAIGYVDLERLTNADVDAMFSKFKATTALIMDMRGYPQGTAWSIAPRLADHQSKIAAVFRRNLVTAGDWDGSETSRSMFTFEQTIPYTDQPRYNGKTVMLIDERAISQSEHSGLFYKTANGTVFVGSPTQGANGDVTYFMAPGGIRIPFSGHDVRWPDGRQLQRVGLTPDIAARPTIAGIRAGRDEVLERAVEYLEKGR